MSDLFSADVLAEVEQINSSAPPVSPTNPPVLTHRLVLLKMHNGDEEALERCAPCQWFLEYNSINAVKNRITR